MFYRSLNLRSEIRNINSSTAPDKHKVKMRPIQFAIEPSLSLVLTFCHFLCDPVDIVHDRIDIHGFKTAVIHDDGAVND